MIEVKIPNGAKELRIKHFKCMAHLPETGLDFGSDRQLFLADFLGLTYNQTLDFRTKDVLKMTRLAIKAFAGMDLASPLPDKIVLNDRVFVLVDPNKIGIGWHIDFASPLTDIQKDPVRLACLFYVPEGFNYSDVDVNGNITHSISSRYELFEQEFPLDLFIRAANFFLKRSLTSIKRSMVVGMSQQKATNRIGLLIKLLSLFNGKRLLKRLWTRLIYLGTKR